MSRLVGGTPDCWDAFGEHDPYWSESYQKDDRHLDGAPQVAVENMKYLKAPWPIG